MLRKLILGIDVQHTKSLQEQVIGQQAAMTKQRIWLVGQDHELACPGHIQQLLGRACKGLTIHKIRVTTQPLIKGMLWGVRDGGILMAQLASCPVVDNALLFAGRTQGLPIHWLGTDIDHGRGSLCRQQGHQGLGLPAAVAYRQHRFAAHHAPRCYVLVSLHRKGGKPSGAMVDIYPMATKRAPIYPTSIAIDNHYYLESRTLSTPRTGYMSRTTLLLPILLASASPAVAAEFEFGGTLEFEYADTRSRVAGVTEQKDSAYIATLELAAAVQFKPNWRADLVLLAEDIENTDPAEFRPQTRETGDLPDKLHVEEFVISYSRDNYSLSAGRYTLPFGNFATAVLSDPQTLEAGETTTSLGATFHQAWEDVSWHLSWFNGNLRDSADDEDGFVISAEWQLNDAWRIGGGYISAQGAGKDAPHLYDLYVTGAVGDWALGAEFVGAAREHNGAKPQTWSLDAAYAINDQWTVGGRWQQTNRFSVLDGGDGDYEELAVAVHHVLFENVHIGLEYADGDEGSSDYEQWLLQVAVLF